MSFFQAASLAQYKNAQQSVLRNRHIVSASDRVFRGVFSLGVVTLDGAEGKNAAKSRQLLNAKRAFSLEDALQQAGFAPRRLRGDELVAQLGRLLLHVLHLLGVVLLLVFVHA